MLRIRTLLIVGGLAGGAALATFGTGDPDVSLASITQLWSDALRDADQAGLQLTRVTDAEEMRIGAEIARAIAARSIAAPSAQDDATTTYVGEVGRLLLPRVRRPGIHYEFHVIQSPDVNAFAVPGGQIFVMTGLLKFVESESELAAVLGHEISHVDLRHTIERYQYETQLKRVGLNEAGSAVLMAHQMATMGFNQTQELEADAQGERLAVEAGYDPAAAAGLFQRMQAKYGIPATRATNTPAGELGGAAGQALGAYFRSHPPSARRAQALDRMVGQHRPSLIDKPYYVGTRNLAELTSRSRQEWPEEWRR
jgi:beta-barrel assembly-enhancing protease